MKIKELPKSLEESFYLLNTRKNDLGKTARNTSKMVIVSLTSIPYRIPLLHLVVRSLLNQNIKFKKILLWLHRDLSADIPKRLRSLQSERFEIRFSDSTSSHRKLVETLKVYPNEHIVTCDDDLMYPADWLERLLESHDKHPKSVIAHRCRVIKYDYGELLPYKQWPTETPGSSSKMTLAIGAGGVLYPPDSLHQDVSNESLFNTLAPKADDLWFKAMSLLGGTPVYRADNEKPEATPIIFTQKYSLKRDNISKDGNREQWLKIAEYYCLEELLNE